LWLATASDARLSCGRGRGRGIPIRQLVERLGLKHGTMLHSYDPPPVTKRKKAQNYAEKLEQRAGRRLLSKKTKALAEERAKAAVRVGTFHSG